LNLFRRRTGRDESRQECTPLNRLLWNGASTLFVGLALGLAGGCDYSRDRPDEMPSGNFTPGSLPVSSLTKSERPGTTARESSDRALILSSSIELIQTAALRPGGENFRMATQQLNQFFEGTPDSEYRIDSAERAYLSVEQWPQELLADLEKPNWDPRTDARHLEDCMMYSVIASRVGGTGDDLARARRVFDWIVQQIQLVPAGMLGSRQLPQVPARPYDVLLRGMATESEGYWAERSWLFMALCRQLGIDVGLVTYSKGNVIEPLVFKAGQNEDGGRLIGPSRTPKPVIGWVCGALIDGKIYLFDARLGLPIPGPDGTAVATMDEVMADSSLLERMDLPGQEPYETSRASLLASSSRIGILIDSSPGYFTPKMKLLQRELSGKNRAVLYRDPAEERDHFAQALGDKLGAVKLWPVPLHVQVQLFRNSQFVDATKQSLRLFVPEYPLIYARIKQLRGEFSQAVEQYVTFRLRQDVPFVNFKKKLSPDEKKIVIPKDIQRGLDAYATHFLGLAHLEQNNLKGAEEMFRMLLDLLPDPAPGQPAYNVLRWGANANLGRIYEARGDRRQAIAYYTQNDPTKQRIGNLLRARELVWDDPMAAPPDPLPPPPPAF
jgi:hypothetical protein